MSHDDLIEHLHAQRDAEMSAREDAEKEVAALRARLAAVERERQQFKDECDEAISRAADAIRERDDARETARLLVMCGSRPVFRTDEYDGAAARALAYPRRGGK